MSTNFHVASAAYPAGTVVNTFAIAAGLSKAVLSLSHDTLWAPNVNAITYALDISYDNGVTWEAHGGGTAAGMAAGSLDIFGVLITASTFKVSLSQPANATTMGRITLNVLIPIVTTIDLTVS